MERLFVVIMPVGSENQHQYRIVEDSVYQTMLLGDAPAPTSLRLPLQRFWVASTCSRMAFQLLYRLVRIVNCIFHQPTRLRNSSRVSPGNILCVLPCRYSSSPRSRLAKNSSRGISVGSACFSETSLRRYFEARFSRFSSSAIMLKLRSISAFICIAVMAIT